MRRAFYALSILGLLASAAFAQQASKPAAPSDPKAQKTYSEALDQLKKRSYLFALDGFRKADKQDGGHCIPCETQAYKAAIEMRNYKGAREEAALLAANATTPADKVAAHILTARACLFDGINNSRENLVRQADTEYCAALAIDHDQPESLYGDAIALAHLNRDAAAKERFEQYLSAVPHDDINYNRAQRFAERPELARGRISPNFRLTTSDGRTITFESLAGKVVLIDFWATWCGPCIMALPNIRYLARHFDGQPFVVISVDLDKDEAKWRNFIAKNGMTWIQAFDQAQAEELSKTFSVNAIPATFTIDADGLLQDQHVGDAEMEGKLKKLIARANELAARKTVAQAAP